MTSLELKALGIFGGTDNETHSSYLEKCLERARNPVAYFSATMVRNLVFEKMPNILFLESRAGTEATGDIGRGRVKIFCM